MTNQVCWEILQATDSVLTQVRNLYQSTQKIEEQIPWEWIEGSISRKQNWEPGRWNPHLLVTAENENSPITGFIYGGFMPGFGGYVTYLGVDPLARKHGLGTLLFEQMFSRFQEDARQENGPLSFVLWESCRPEWNAPESDWKIWTARMKLFHRVGGFWMAGLDLLSPNYIEEESDPITLQLFLKPVDSRLPEFDSTRLKEIALGLQQKIYHLGSEDPLVTGTFPPGCLPQMKSPLTADRSLERGQRSLL